MIVFRGYHDEGFATSNIFRRIFHLARGPPGYVPKVRTTHWLEVKRIDDTYFVSPTL